MKRSGPRTTSSNLPESVQQHLSAYALAAGAAGVSVLALVQPSEAKIVYTSTNVTIRRGQHHSLNLNHDGVRDFRFIDGFYNNTCGGSWRISELPTKGNGVVGTAYAYALSAGYLIGHTRDFNAGKAVMERAFEAREVGGVCVLTYLGKWHNVDDRYLGLAFQVHGKTHYGWARLSVHWAGAVFGLKATLTGYAYETIPGKSIKAGQTKSAEGNADDFGRGVFMTNPMPPSPRPASLGLLALGTQGVPLWRRKKSAATTSGAN